MLKWIQNLPSWLQKLLEKFFAILPLELLARFFPGLNKFINQRIEELMQDIPLPTSVYREECPSFTAIPMQGLPKETILEDMTKMADKEKSKWQDGFVSGAVYHGAKEHVDFLSDVYRLYSQSNPLHLDIWPSLGKFEAEIVTMASSMLGAKPEDDIGGTVTSGGTESILLAIKTYRDYAFYERRVLYPELIVPVSAHAAFDKACELFKIKKVELAVDENYQAKVRGLSKLITRNTIAIVGSAPSFPHGIIDPIVEMAAIAKKYKVGFHTDACLGGFILPWAPTSYQVPWFDFRIPGVTSISADTHKFGYASKGSSVVLYRAMKLRQYQYFVVTNWPGGLYFSPTLAGSRPGALSAQCWASLVAMGQEGYREATRKILETADFVKAEIRKISELEILGNPLWVIAFRSKSSDIYQIMQFMSERGWSLNGLHRPSCVHICITLRHTEPGVAERFVEDLKWSVEASKGSEQKTGMAPIYGLGATMPARSMVAKLLRHYVDAIYKVKK